ncbi:magnesium transporter NIPA-domain-containing protein [Gloeopeniophorella convolvens]|nr:magnesium transporter NIPA-domain-containing protein [Gloeopeniophorella convolvens]
MSLSSFFRDIGFPSMSHATVAGITVAIIGNVIISLALNLQKLAHARLDAARDTRLTPIPEESESPPPGAPPLEPPPELEREARVWNGTAAGDGGAGERQPLLPVSSPPTELRPMEPAYGAVLAGDDDGRVRGVGGVLLRWKQRRRGPQAKGTAGKSAQSNGHGRAGDGAQETAYLRSKLWWLGFLLMNVGEIGNFISYAFAPASIVAPLGTFALIANCLFAPLLLHERLRKRDLFGVALAIVGAVTVVFSANTSDSRLSPERLIQAISQRVFLVFSIVYAIIAFILAGLSERSAGRRWVLVDVGLCAIFGGFTVLSTKAFSTLLTTRGLEMFEEWITYPILAVLVGTGIGQIRYLNRALMRFDSKVVIPTQFVLFNLSAILGSAILYGDFRRAKFHQFVTFMYGCAATFAGVWIIAWVPKSSEVPSADDADETGGDAEAEGLGLLVDGLPVNGAARRPGTGVPVIRSRRSTVSFVGLSPAQVRIVLSCLWHASGCLTSYASQRLLVINTPPRSEPPLGPGFGTWEGEHPGRLVDGSIGRRRAISWMDVEGSPVRRPGSRPRDSQRSVERA